MLKRHKCNLTKYSKYYQIYDNFICNRNVRKYQHLLLLRFLSVNEKNDGQFSMSHFSNEVQKINSIQIRK